MRDDTGQTGPQGGAAAPVPRFSALVGPQVARALRRTLWGLWAERLAQAFWPLWSVALLIAASLWLGLPAALPEAALLWALVGAGAALLAALLLGLWRFVPPTRGDAWHRLDSALPGRPLSALVDQPAIGMADEAALAVWRAHLDRMAQRALAARGVPGNPRLPQRDPFALRYAALLALVVALVFGGTDRIGTVPPVVSPFGAGPAGAAPGPAWEGWVQPPAYTGQPSLYLNEIDSPTLTLPEGSRVTIRLYGPAEVLRLTQSVSEPAAGAMAEVGDDLSSQTFEVLRAGVISIQGPGGREWEVALRPDAAPTIRPESGIERERGGLMRQDFSAADDYGLTGGAVTITLDLAAVDRRHGLAPDPEPRDPVVLSLPLPISGARVDFTEALVEDLTQHPWARLPVTVVLRADDARGQSGESAVLRGTLPGRSFFDPLAAALIELRRDLLWTAANGPRTARLIRAVRHRPDEIFEDDATAEALGAILVRLEEGMAEGGLSPDRRDEIASALWELATAIEAGDPDADAEARLRRAQDRLAEAIRQGADPGEIDDLMQELREAMREALRERARNAPPDAGDNVDSGDQQEITGDQIQQMLDRIQELMDQGRVDEALALLEQLQALLENLEVTQGEGGEGGDGDNPLSGLGETLRDQQDLADETFRDLQEQFGQQPGPREGQAGRSGEGEDPSGRRDGEADRGETRDGEGGGDAGGGERTGTLERDLAARQQELRDALRDHQAEPIPGDGTDLGEQTRRALDEAERAMEEAEERLRRGDAAGALDRQARAIEQLREGLRGMNEALARRNGESEPGADGDETGTRSARLDPLGREMGPNGAAGVDDPMMQGEGVDRRAQDILDEIRRRSAERDRPAEELDYLGRLLDRF